MGREYVDFDVDIKRVATGYVTTIRDAAPEPVTEPFVMPFEPTELAQFMVAVGPPRAASRRLVPATARLVGVKDYGRRLGEALFSGAVGEALRTGLASARAQHRDVRIRLALGGVPELEPVPWEYVYSESLGRFLTLSAKTPLVRLFDALDVSPAVTVAAPLRVLVMISSPTDMPALAVDREVQLLQATTGDLVGSGQLELVVLHDATLTALQRALLEEYHVFHFVGHGGFDPDAQEGVLVLEREDGTAHRVSGQRLGTLLHDAQGMQLAVLNACEGARTSGRDAFSGVGQALVRQGLPAVVAMQTEISDRAALVFSHEFYYFLTRGLGIDAAICEVRKAMAVSDEASEWGTAVLMRSRADQPFSFMSTTTGRVDRSGRWDSLYAAAQAALAADAPATALPMLEQIVAERPDYADVAQLIERARQRAPEASSQATPSPSHETTTSSPTPHALEATTEVQNGDPSGNADSRVSTLDEESGVSEAEHRGRSDATSRRRKVAALLASAGLLSGLVAVGVWRPELLPWNVPSTPSSARPPTPGTSKIIEVPPTGPPTHEVVLPYAFSGQLHYASGDTQPLGVDEAVADVLLVMEVNARVQNAVVSTSIGGAELKGANGKTIVDLGDAGRAIANQDGSKFAFVDFNGSDGSGAADYGIVVMDASGRRVDRLSDVMGRTSDPDVVGFVDDAVFYTLDGSTWRWDTRSDERRLWRHDSTVAFNSTTRTGVGTSLTGCFAVLDVNQASERTVPLDCHGVDPIGISSDGTQAIATNKGHDRVYLVPIVSGADAPEFRLSQKQVFEQVVVFSPDQSVVLDVRTAEGDRMVSCRFDGLCNVLTETHPAPAGLNGPPAHVIAR